MKITLSRAMWVQIGTEAGWLTAEAKQRWTEATPFKICTDKVGREDKEKYNSCVEQIQKQHKKESK